MKTLLETLKRKWAEYLLEILVISIGILVAFALNNWKEDRSTKRLESEVLNLIEDNLYKDSIALITIRRNNDLAIRAAGRLLAEDSDELSDDSVGWYLGKLANFDRFRPSTSAFEVLKSNGLNIINNIELKLAIISYYDDHSTHLLQSLNDVESSFKNDWVPLLKDEFQYFEFKNIALPKEPQTYIQKIETISYIMLFRDNRLGITPTTQECLESITLIKKLIRVNRNNL